MKFLLFLALFQGDVQDRAKIAFDNVVISKQSFDNCVCQNCDCIDCQCTKEKCICKECNDFQAIYTRAIKEQQVVVLKVGKDISHIDNVPWKQIAVPSITGEKPGYIIGVPKDGQLIRLDCPAGTPRQRIRLDILHIYYPLSNGYVECPACPQGRIKSTR